MSKEMYKIMVSYFDNLFIMGGGGQVYGYKTGTYYVTYAIDRFDYETLHAIERKMYKLGMEITRMEIRLHPDVEMLRIFFCIQRREEK